MRATHSLPLTTDQTVSDPYWDKVVYYSRFESGVTEDLTGKNSPTTGGTVGSFTQATTATKFGSYSAYHSTGGSSASGSRIQIGAANNTNFLFNNNDLTIETWIYITSLGADPTNVGHNYNIFSLTNQVTTTANKLFLVEYAAGAAPNFVVGFWDGAAIFNGTKKFDYNQWVHIALCKQGTTIYASVNGQVENIGTSTPAWNTTAGGTWIGNDGYNENGATWYIDEFRITNGVARYTSNFPVQTKPYPTGTLP